MTFDARAWVEANTPPVFVDLDGRTFTGRLWSHLEYVKWVRVFREWLAGNHDPAGYEKELRDMIASMGFSEEAVDRMLKLPDGAFEGLMKDFFERQRAGRDPAPSTPGPQPQSSPDQTSPTTAPASPPSAS